MGSTTDAPKLYRLNVLTLDGGGVRGLSALLILLHLMQYINASIREGRPDGELHEDVSVHQIFEFVAGTSTGGLIAIMLGKLGMTLEDCIQTYHDLSRKIFGKKHIRGMITHGLAPTRYSGSRLRHCIRELVTSTRLDENLPMISTDGSDAIACAVVCREHYHQSKYSDFKPGAVRICSLPCGDSLECHVCDAARATSAAPTFFPVQSIADRSFVDGGMEHNNPSETIFDHYTEYLRVAGSKRLSVVENSPAASSLRHGNLDFSRVRFVNLGTGTKPDSLPPRRRDKLANLVPSVIRMGIFLKRTLTEFAVNSENIANHMRTLAWVSGDGADVNFEFERFSADNGVCYMKLDSYKDLQKIQDLTLEYLGTAKTRSSLKRVAEEIAGEYLEKHRTEPVPPADPTILPVLGKPSAAESSVTLPVAGKSSVSESRTPLLVSEKPSASESSTPPSQNDRIKTVEKQPSSASSSANFNDSQITEPSLEASTLVTEPDNDLTAPTAKPVGGIAAPVESIVATSAMPTDSTNVTVSA